MRRSWIAPTALLAACGGSTGAVGTETVPTPVPTVAGVGSLPETIPATPPATTEPLVVITRPLDADGEEAQPIGDQVGGNRLLMIGDSIFAGTESRYGGEMCAGLEPLGWAVEIAAEAGRFVEFGVKVVEANVPEADQDIEAGREAEPDPGFQEPEESVATSVPLPPPAGADDWDAAAVFLGSNYNGDQDNYDEQMRTILDRLSPRPTLLYTVTEFRPDYDEVSEVIEGLVADYPNVTLIDWATAAETPGVLRSDGLHPGDAGEQVLVELTAAALGEAPDGEADCIRSRFRDDSAIKDGNGSPNTSDSSSTSNGSSSSSSSSSNSSSSSSSGSGSSSGGGGTTDSTDGSTDGGDGTDGGDSTDDGDSTDGDGTDGSTDGGSTDGSTDGGSTDGGSDGTSGDGTDGSTGGGTDGGGSTDDGGGSEGGGGSSDGSGSSGGSSISDGSSGSTSGGTSGDGDTDSGS